MPLVRIDMVKGKSPEYKKTVLDVVHEGLIEAFGIEDWDRFQRIVEIPKEDFEKKNPGEYYFMTRYGKVPPSDIDFKAAEGPIYLIFGKESTGVPYDILKAHIDRCFRIPMAGDCRSLNLSNAAAIAIYECERQLGYPGLSLTEVQKGEDFLESYDATLGR